jgi:uncharacterized protein with HEPN domain
MNDRNKKYLSDIIKAIDLVESFLSETSNFDDYSSDEKTQSAVERQLGIIGEAANKIDESISSDLSSIPKIIGLRNRLVHAYDQIDETIIWAIINNHLPELKKEVRFLLKN